MLRGKVRERERKRERERERERESAKELPNGIFGAKHMRQSLIRQPAKGAKQ